MNSFTAFDYSCGLDDEMAMKVSRYAERRVAKATVVKEFAKSLNATNKIAPIRHADLTLGECIGQGAFSSVFTIKLINTEDKKKKFDEKKLVVKVLRSKLLQDPQTMAVCPADLYKEGVIMATFNHPNIMNIQAWAPDGVSAYINGRHDAFFLVLDRLDETLRDKLHEWKKQSRDIQMGLTRNADTKRTALLEERMDAIMQLSSAVKYMHSKRLMHRDMKPDNMGFQDGVLKVFDFDVSRTVPEATHPNVTFKLTKRVGSPRYMAPEVAKGEEYNLGCDVYTFSLLVHEMLTLEKPYDNLPIGQHDELVFVEGVRPPYSLFLAQGTARSY